MATLPELAKKWTEAKRRNSVLALKDLESLSDKYDTEECKERLTDFRDLDRADYDDAEEYREARDEAWEEFTECLESLAGEEEEEQSQQAASPVSLPVVRYGPREAWKEAQSLYPIGHRTLIAEAEHTGISQEEVQFFLARAEYEERYRLSKRRWEMPQWREVYRSYEQAVEAERKLSEQ